MKVTTDRLYHHQLTLSKCTARVLKNDEDEHGGYLVFDRTIFHAQGGGQPLDEGTIVLGEQKVTLKDIKEAGPDLKHYVPDKSRDRFPQGAEVIQEINAEKRLLYSKLHSTGHLISALVEEKYPGLISTKGNHFPGGQAYVFFKGTSFPDKEELKVFLQEKVAALIASDLKVTISEGTSGQARKMTIEGYPEMACGGTHVSSFGGIKNFTIRNIKKQKGELKISYDVE